MVLYNGKKRALKIFIFCLRQARSHEKFVLNWIHVGRDPLYPTHRRVLSGQRDRVDGDEVAWFLLTSSNLSRSAWGFLDKKACTMREGAGGVLDGNRGDTGCSNRFVQHRRSKYLYVGFFFVCCASVEIPVSA